jgi:hypothetical protein
MIAKTSLVVLAVLATACGGGANRTNGVTQEQLNGALLTAADVPATYTVDPTGDPPSTASPAAPGADCPTRFAALGNVSGGRAVLTAQRRFQGPGAGTVLKQTVARIADQKDAAPRLQQVRAVIAGCPRFTLGSGATAQAVTLRTLDAGPIGDAAVAFGVTVSSRGVVYAADEVLAAVGRSLVLIAQGGRGTPDLALAKASAAAAVRRLSGLPG